MNTKHTPEQAVNGKLAQGAGARRKAKSGKRCKRKASASKQARHSEKQTEQHRHEGDQKQTIVTPEDPEWEIIEDEAKIDPEEMLDQFKRYARQRLGAWDSCGIRTEEDAKEQKSLRKKVDRFAGATKEGHRLQRCHKCARVGYPLCHQACRFCSRNKCLSHATAHDFLWSGQEGDRW